MTKEHLPLLQNPNWKLFLFPHSVHTQYIPSTLLTPTPDPTILHSHSEPILDNYLQGKADHIHPHSSLLHPNLVYNHPAKPFSLISRYSPNFTTCSSPLLSRPTHHVTPSLIMSPSRASLSLTHLATSFPFNFTLLSAPIPAPLGTSSPLQFPMNPEPPDPSPA